MQPQERPLRVLSVSERRDLGLPLACIIMTMNPLTEFMQSEGGRTYYRTMNDALQWLAPSANVHASANFAQACMIDAKTVLSVIPRTSHVDLLRFNAACKFFVDVCDSYKTGSWNIQQMDTLRSMVGRFVGERTVLHVEGKPSTNEQATDAAAVALLAAGKVRGRFTGLTLPDSVH